MTNPVDTNINVSQSCKIYIYRSIVLCAILFSIGLLVQNPLNVDLLLPLVVSALFSLVVDVAEAVAWHRIADKPDDVHVTFFMAVSGFRFLLALAVMVAYFLVMGREAMLTFILVFLAYYVVMLAHHVAFFSFRKQAVASQPNVMRKKNM